MVERLAGRCAVVTGGGRGIGRAIVERLVAEGAAVAFSYARHREPAEELAATLNRSGAIAIAVAANVSVAEDCERLVEAARTLAGRVDILVNNAAETDTHRAWDTISEQEWDRVMAVNAKGPFLCFRAAYPHLVKSPAARVINISSVTFQLGLPRLAHYVASKGAVTGFTRSLAREIGLHGITVNAVAPGAIRTDAEVEIAPDADEVARSLERLQAIPRRGTTADIAAAVAFLASDDAGFITGQVLTVDGGWSMS